jgi:acyl carrier protein
MQQLVSLLVKELAIKAKIDEDTPLVSSGIVDSLKFADLLAVLGRHYGVTIDPNDVGTDNFDTPAQMLAYVKARQ